MDIYKSSNVNIGIVMKNTEMLKFVPHYLKIKKYCKHIVKKLPYLLTYVPDQYKFKKMCDKAIFENSGTLKSVSDWYKTQKMCNKAVFFCILFYSYMDIKLKKCVSELFLKIFF